MKTPLTARAGVVVHYVPCTSTKPDRYSVRIRDFPSRTYSSHRAPDDMNYTDKPEFFARKRLDELGLHWTLTGLCFVVGVGFVFTTN
jgi:hypothetical protein